MSKNRGGTIGALALVAVVLATTSVARALLVNDCNAAPVGGFMGPTGGLIQKLDADRLSRVLA